MVRCDFRVFSSCCSPLTARRIELFPDLLLDKHSTRLLKVGGVERTNRQRALPVAIPAELPVVVLNPGPDLG